MGERKKKKRGQLREVIVPLPLDSTLNRLNNRAAQLRCNVSMKIRKTDRRELDLGIGYSGRNKRGEQIVSDFWRTSVTLESLDKSTTQVSYTSLRPQFFLYFPIIVFMVVWVWFALASNTSLSTATWNTATWIMLVSLGSIGLLINSLFLLHRRRVLLKLLHDLDKPLGEN
jgi:hypothetical protein